MVKPLTVAAVEKMKGTEARREVPDALVPGLYLIIQPTGRKSWALRYRHEGKTAKHTIGSYPGVELTDARDQARDLLKDLAKGKTPEQSKADRKAAEPLTFAALAADYIERHAKRKKKSWAEDEATIARDLLPTWGQRSAGTITKRDVIALIEVKAKVAPVRANRVLSLVSKIFNWSVAVCLLPASPVGGVEPPSEETSRDRVLTDAELRDIWQATGEMAWPWASFFRVLALTAQRRTEVAAMRWADLDLKAGLWTLPREANKGARVHDVPLSTEVVEIIKAAPRFAEAEGEQDDGRATDRVAKPKPEFVFSTTGGRRPISGYSKAKKELDALIARLRAETRLGRKLREKEEPAAEDHMQPWVIHDFRRTATTNVARFGFGPHVASAILNHSPRSAGSGTNAVTAIYQRYRYDKERRAALEAWARHLTQKPPADNVVRLHASA